MRLLASGQPPVEGGLTESPGKKGWHKGAQAQLAPCSTHFCKTSCFHCSLLS